MEYGTTILMEQRQAQKYTFFFVILLFINFFWFLGTTVSDLLIDELVAAIGGVQEDTFNLIQGYDSIYQFTVAGAVILFGILVDHFHEKRRMMLISLNLLWIIINFVFYFAPISLSLYLIILIIWGVTMGGNGPIIFSYLGDLFKVEFRGKLFSIFATVLYFIKGSSNSITGILGQESNNWKLPFLITALGGLVFIILFALKVKDPHLGEIEPEMLGKSPSKYTYRFQFSDLREILKQRTNLLLIIQGFFGMFGVTIVNRYIFYWLTGDFLDGYNLNNTLVVLLLFISAVFGAVLGINLSGWLSDRFFKEGNLHKMLFLPIICIFGEVIGYGLLIFLPSYPELIEYTGTNPFELFSQYPVFWQFFMIFNLNLFFGTAIGPAVGTVRTHLNLPENRGTAAALYDTADFFGAGVALILGSMISGVLDSLRLTIFYGALFWIISGIIWLFIVKYIDQDYLQIREKMQKRLN